MEVLYSAKEISQVPGFTYWPVKQDGNTCDF
jgi:hypothetical protein